MTVHVERIDHTGDAGLRAEGPDPASVMVALAEGMARLQVAEGEIRGLITREISARAADPTELLVAWLAEILYVGSVHGEVYGEAEIRELDLGDPEALITPDRCRLRGVVRGEPLDPERHVPGPELKAVTYHLAELRPEGNRWVGRVLFDL